MERTREALFEILVREHELGLLAFVRSCVHHADAAEDLAQETFLAAWQRLEEYDEARPFARWLRGIAKNKILESLRSQATRRRHVGTLTPDQLDAISNEFDRLIPGRGDVIGETLAALRQCLTTLSAAQRDVVRRAYEQKQTCRAIADQLGHSIEAVKKRLQRARAQLRDCILGKLKMEQAHG